MNTAEKCKECAGPLHRKHDHQCRTCFETSTKQNRCGECWFDRVCARCGDEIAYAPNNGSNMTMCDACEVALAEECS